MPLLPSEYDNELAQALACLVNVGPSTAAALSRALEADHGIQIHWRRIDALFRKEIVRKSGVVARRRKDGTWHFSALPGTTRKLEHSGASNDVVLVDPSRAVSATQSLHETLRQFRGALAICDPYLDSTSLHHLDSCGEATSLRLLTTKVTDSGELRVLLGAFASSGRPIEVRTTKGLHDRYLICPTGMVILGTSLNGFGKKQHFIFRAGADVRKAVLTAFEALWASASVWPKP